MNGQQERVLLVAQPDQGGTDEREDGKVRERRTRLGFGAGEERRLALRPGQVREVEPLDR